MDRQVTVITQHSRLIGISIAVFVFWGTCLSFAAGVPGSIYHEAPQLEEAVQAGQLPPVDARLPENPMLIQPVDGIGAYGGTWHRAIRKTRDHASFIRTIGYENLVRWDPQWISVIPNIAERFLVNEDATTYTFYLRKGMRWSDGAPFTADDILFWYEDVLLNKDLTPSIPGWLTSGGTPVTVIKRDETTVVFSFATPNGLFLMNLAAPWGGEPTAYPRHYLQQFHPKYQPDGRLPQSEASTWWTRFRQKAGHEVDDPLRWQNPDLPRLHAWRLTEPYHQDIAQVVAERNPYYWKIDPMGNQLPYIDRVVFTAFSDNEQLDAMMRQNAIDMQARHIPQQSLNTMKRAHTFSLISSFSNTAVISLNLTHPDPVLRGVFQQKDFRIGLSYAIPRQEIILKVFHGEGVPYQAAPRPESPLYHERLARQFTAYDPTLANAYLDRAGCGARDAEGFRLRPDGERIQITLDVIDFFSLAHIAPFIAASWENVGIETRVNLMEREALYACKRANQHDAVLWVGDGGLDVFLDPRWYFPYSLESNFAIPWAYWYRDYEDPRGHLPPDAARRQMDLYNRLLATANQAKQDALMTQILEIAADQFYVIGICTPPLRYGILAAHVHNVPSFIPYSWTYPDPAPTNPCQYWLETRSE